MRYKSVVANWKTHTGAIVAGRPAKGVADGVGLDDRISGALFPPFPYAVLVGPNQLRNTP